MEDTFDQRLSQYKDFFEHFSEENLEKFRDIASPTVRYRDPLSDSMGIDATIQYFQKLFFDLDAITFEFNNIIRLDKLVFSDWKMCFRIKMFPKKLWEVHGVSKIIFTDAGKVEDQIDYWDASPLLAGFPVLGLVVKLLSKLFCWDTMPLLKKFPLLGRLDASIKKILAQ